MELWSNIHIAIFLGNIETLVSHNIWAELKVQSFKTASTSQNLFVISSAVNFPIAEVLLVALKELKLANLQRATATHFFTGIAF